MARHAGGVGAAGMDGRRIVDGNGLAAVALETVIGTGNAGALGGYGEIAGVGDRAVAQGQGGRIAAAGSRGYRG